MLYRRLYFLFPDASHALGVTGELVQSGVDEQHIHAVARDGVDLTSLPQATVRSRHRCATGIAVSRVRVAGGRGPGGDGGNFPGRSLVCAARPRRAPG